MRLSISHSLFWKLFAPIAVLLFVAASAAAILLPLALRRNAEREAVEAGQETARQFKTLRTYYTDKVIAKVTSHSNLQVSFDHLTNPNAIPLPATMVHDLSAATSDSGTTLKLYSPYPFPNRQERVLDRFGLDAWAFLNTHPDQIFSRIESVGDHAMVRVAIADRMTSQTCVACHNSLATSPKKDWKLGDVRGVLEVDSSRQLDSGTRIATVALAVLAGLMLLFSFALRVFYQRSIARPLNKALDAAHELKNSTVDKLRSVEAIADGNLEREVTVGQCANIDSAAVSKDELGTLLHSVVDMSDAQHSLDLSFRKMQESLRVNRKTEQERDWLKSGLNNVNDIMRDEQDVHLLAQRLLPYLAKRLQADAGAFYLYEEASANLQRAAVFALQENDRTSIAAGPEGGLLGQAVHEDRTMLLSNVPHGYLRAGSALGSADPACIVAVPLLHGDNCVGALELGAFKTFSAIELEFLETVRESLAIGLEVCQSRQKTRILLHETEQQAEELRVQQEELQQSNEELEERAEMLERQREQIRQKNEQVELASQEIMRKAEELQKISAYKTEFMANISHELRTPLNSMLILSGLLKENKTGNLTPKQVEYVATINGAGHDLLNLINDLLDLAKVEAGQIDFLYRQVSPSELCASMAALFHFPAEQKGLSLTTELDDDVPATIRIDAQRTSQILKNLISNAIKFTQKGEVRLHIHQARSSDEAQGQTAIAFAVSDTGIGVPSDKQQMIFEAFKQADGGINRTYGGTGLGLSISLQLAHRMHGSLTLRSVPGEGSTFTLILPANGEAAATNDGVPEYAGEAAQISPAAPASRVADDSEAAGKNRGTILIVEDDRHFASLLIDFVRQRGYLGIHASDGEEGVAFAKRYLPSAILLDVMLPKLDGWEVMRRLKDNLTTRHIPVHFITCLEERRRAMEMGAIGLTRKPVTTQALDEVLDTLEAALAHSVRRLLIVEDDPRETASLKELLSAKDVAICTAASGEEALAFLRAERYDCMVLDLGLTGMSGFELLEHVQDLAPELQPPIIVHSGRELTRDEEKAIGRYTESIVVKGAKSSERLLNEVTLFLHMVESRLEPEQQQLLHTPIDTGAQLEGKTVLVVDDDMRNVFSLASILSSHGMVVVEAENGHEALRQLTQHPAIDIVLMDIMMPELDGYETMRRIRANSVLRDLPIIAMTAKVMKDDRQKCLDAGANDYIAKPIDMEKLMSLLRVWAVHRA